MTMRMRDLSPEQRPRERILAGRGDELGEAELLALVWGSGSQGLSAVELAHGILARCGGLSGLMGLGPAEWASFEGIGPARAGQLWATMELSRRLRRGATRPVISSPQAAGAYLIQRCQGWTEERFGLLALNTRSLLLAERILSQGTPMATLVSPREFFREALRFGAVSVIAFHNHPSGVPHPSAEDTALTRRLVATGQTLGIPVVDHLIIGVDGYYSYRTAERW
jgi:DNA repair protein RadC